MRRYFLLALVLNVFLIPQVFAGNQDQIDRILKEEVAPFGVVFEIVEGSKEDLNWAFAEVKKYAAQLRKRFPDIGISVVSHGKEQFGLMTSEEKNFQQVHKTIKSLVADDSIPVHVCGTHASWYDKTADDFPDYIEVSPAGPTEIKAYEEMGYELVILVEPRNRR